VVALLLHVIKAQAPNHVVHLRVAINSICDCTEEAIAVVEHALEDQTALSQALLAAGFLAGGSVGLAVAGQCLFMAAFSIGSGPCSMMVSSECFPLQVRGLAMGVATLLNRLISGAIALSFLSLTRALTPAGTFIMFTFIALFACAFIKRMVPETKGRALEEIEQEMVERLKIHPGGGDGGSEMAGVPKGSDSRIV